MPILEITNSDFRKASFDSDQVVVMDVGMKSRRLTPSTVDYDPSGLYAVFNEIELDKIEIRELSEIFGFSIRRFDTDAAIDSGDKGDILFQLSLDGGTTYNYWNGSAWATAGANDFSTADDIEENISSIGFGAAPSLRFKIRIVASANRNFAPILQAISFMYEVNHNLEEDLLRSIVTYVNDNVRIKKKIQLSSFPFVDGDSITLGLNQIFLPTAFVLVNVEIYNLANDPTRQTNLFLSMVRATDNESYVITLSSAQGVGDSVEVKMEMTTEVFVGTDTDFFNSTVPAVAITIVSTDPAKDVRVYGREVMVNKKTKLARIRDEEFWEFINVSILISTRGELNSQLALASFKRHLRDIGVSPFLSIGHGQSFFTYDVQPYNDTDNESDAVFRKGFNIILLGRVFSNNYEEVKIAENIDMKIQQIGFPQEFESLPNPNFSNINIDEL